MVEQQLYTSETLPAALHCQIVSFLRVVWPEGFCGPNRLRTWISSDPARTRHIVLVEEGVLIGHTEVRWKTLEHAGETYTVAGLCDVFTYPSFRDLGYGRRIVEAGTAYIRATDADLGILYCAHPLCDFYAASGWIAMDEVTTLIGDMNAPERSREVMMLLVLSSKGQRARDAFGSTPLYFGEETW